jgi:hypothetical protein
MSLAAALDSHFAFLDRLRRCMGECVADRLAAVTADMSDFASVAADALDQEATGLSTVDALAALKPQTVQQRLRQLDGLIAACEAQRGAMQALLRHPEPPGASALSAPLRTSHAAPRTGAVGSAWRIDNAAHVPAYLARVEPPRPDASGSSQSQHHCEFDCDLVQAKTIQSQAEKVLPLLKTRRCVAEEAAMRRAVSVTEASTRCLVELMHLVGSPSHRLSKDLCRRVAACETAAADGAQLAGVALQFEAALRQHERERASVVAHFDVLFSDERRRADSLVSGILRAHLASLEQYEEAHRAAIEAAESDACENAGLLVRFAGHMLLRGERKSHNALQSICCSVQALAAAAQRWEKATQTSSHSFADDHRRACEVAAVGDAEQASRRALLLEEAQAFRRELETWHLLVRATSAILTKDNVIASLQRQLALMQQSSAAASAWGAAPRVPLSAWSAASSRSPSTGYSPPSAPLHLTIASPGLRAEGLFAGPGNSPAGSAASESAPHHRSGFAVSGGHALLLVLSMCEGLELVHRDQLTLRERSDRRIIADAADSLGIAMSS